MRLISETHQEEAKLMTAVKEAKQSAWAGAGTAAISTTLQVREFSHWSATGSPPNLCAFICTDEAGALCPNPRLAGRVIRVTGSEILLLTAYFEHSVELRIEIHANLMHEVCFSYSFCGGL